MSAVPDASIHLTFDRKDARWRVLVELPNGDAWASEDPSLRRAVESAALDLIRKGLR